MNRDDAADAIGPRVEFGESCLLYAEFFEPGVVALIRAFALEAPPLVGRVMVVTDAWRAKLDNTPSWHPYLCAIDVRSGVEDDTPRRGAIIGDSVDIRYDRAVEWRNRVAVRVGAEYDIVYGRAVNHVDHVHGEWDQRKRRRTHG